VSSRTWKEAATSVPVLMQRSHRESPLGHPSRVSPREIGTSTRRAAQHPDDPLPTTVPPGFLPVCPSSNLAHSVSLESPFRNDRGSCEPGPEVPPPTLPVAFRPWRASRTTRRDGARVPGPSEGRVPEARCGRCRPARVRTPWFAHADDVPLLGAQGTPHCRRRDRPQGKRPAANETDRPRSPLHRHPAKGAGFLETRVPSTATDANRSGFLPPIRAGLLFAPPTLFPQAGEKCRCSGIASSPHPPRRGVQRTRARLRWRASTFGNPR
jgi:hypothetical protein